MFSRIGSAVVQCDVQEAVSAWLDDCEAGVSPYALDVSFDYEDGPVGRDLMWLGDTEWAVADADGEALYCAWTF